MKHTVERSTPAESPEPTPKAAGVSSAPVQAAPDVEDDAAVWRDPATAPVSPPPPPEPPVRESAPQQPTSEQQADQPPPRQASQPIPRRPRNAATISPRRAARRTRVVVRKVGPLSVLKFSLVFYFCVMLIIYLALLIIWVVLSAAGGIDALARLLGQVFPPERHHRRGATAPDRRSAGVHVAVRHGCGIRVDLVRHQRLRGVPLQPHQ